jgi:hypothetical protein
MDGKNAFCIPEVCDHLNNMKDAVLLKKLISVIKTCRFDHCKEIITVYSGNHTYTAWAKFRASLTLKQVEVQ